MYPYDSSGPGVLAGLESPVSSGGCIRSQDIGGGSDYGAISDFAPASNGWGERGERAVRIGSWMLGGILRWLRGRR
jgi:hypothetical protein